MRLWENKCDLMRKRMDFKAYGKLNVILWEKKMLCELKNMIKNIEI